jgi:hypothetical protein
MWLNKIFKMKTKTLKLSEAKALELYKTASKEFKEILEESFGVEFFKPRTLFDVIKNYSDVCKQLCEPEQSCPYQKLKQIERLFNGDWRKDWSNFNQYKYYPYFSLTGVGLVFDVSDFDCSGSGGRVAYFKDKQTSDFVGRTFVDIYRQL